MLYVIFYVNILGIINNIRYVVAQLLSHVQLHVTAWAVAH